MIGIARSNNRSVRGHVLDDAALVAGVNDRVQLAMIGAEMNRRICEQHMRGGATIVDPASTWIDVQVEVGQDVIIPAEHPSQRHNPDCQQLRDRTGLNPEEHDRS